MTDARAPDLPGIDDLEIVGRGGYAVVYRGRQPSFERDVAVKVIQRSGLESDDRRRFERECKAMGAISDHPGIVTLYDASFTGDGQPYLVMPYIAGGTLHDRIVDEGPMGWRDATDLGIRLSGALETAHRAGVLHRDIKPANVLRSPYGGQLSDFGIARIQGGHETRTGLVTASLSHAAPEILDGSPPTARGDVYSLSSTLHEALSGRAPFVRDTDEGLVPMMRRVMFDPPPDLRPHGVPDELATVIERAMSKDPADRYPTAEAFGHALQSVQVTLGVPTTTMAIVGDPAESAHLDPTPPVGATTVIASTPPTATPGPAEPTEPPTPATTPPTTVIAATPPNAPPAVVAGRPYAAAAPRSAGGDAGRRGSGGSGKAALIAFMILLVLAAAGTAYVLLSEDDGPETGGPTTLDPVVTTVEPVTTGEPATTVAPDTTIEPATTPSPSTDPATSAPPTPEQLAFAQLEDYVTTDAPTVDLLAERWVPQLSAKREGLDVDGTIFGFPEILADHQIRRDTYGAIVVDGATYNFRLGDDQMVGWYITIAPIGFDTADGALGWCIDQGIDRENCVAKFISSTVFDNTLRLNP